MNFREPERPCKWCGVPNTLASEADCPDNPARRLRDINEAATALRDAVRAAHDLLEKRIEENKCAGIAWRFFERDAIHAAQERARSAAYGRDP